MNLATSGCWNESYKKAQPIFLIFYHSNCCLFFLSVVETKLLLKTTEHTSHQPQTLSHPPTRANIHTHILLHSRSRSRSHSFTFSLSLYLSLSHTHTHEHTHARTQNQGYKSTPKPTSHHALKCSLAFFERKESVDVAAKVFLGFKMNASMFPFFSKCALPFFALL